MLQILVQLLGKKGGNFFNKLENYSFLSRNLSPKNSGFSPMGIIPLPSPEDPLLGFLSWFEL